MHPDTLGITPIHWESPRYILNHRDDPKLHRGAFLNHRDDPKLHRDDPKDIREDAKTVRDDPETVRDDPGTARDDPELAPDGPRDVREDPKSDREDAGTDREIQDRIGMIHEILTPHAERCDTPRLAVPDSPLPRFAAAPSLDGSPFPQSLRASALSLLFTLPRTAFRGWKSSRSNGWRTTTGDPSTPCSRATCSISSARTPRGCRK